MNEHAKPTNAAWWYLDRHVDEDTADALCLISEEGELTYRGLAERVRRAARVLTEASVGPGDRVVTVLRDSATAVVCVLAAMRAGAVPVPVSPLLTADEQVYVIEDSGARAVVLERPDTEVALRLADGAPHVALFSHGPGGGRVKGLVEEMERAAPLEAVVDRAPEDPALIQYTSGSTGRPKGVVHLHRGLLAFPQGLGKHLGITREDRVLSSAKLPFGYGFGNSVLLPFSVGASAVLFAGRAEPHAVADLLRRTRPTLLFAVPTLYAALLSMPQASRRLELSTVRMAVSAGEHLGPQLANRLLETLGLRVVNGLGSTECLHIFMATDPAVFTPGATGLPVPGFEAEVCDDEGRRLPPGGMGHLRVRGPSVADRYWNRPDLSARTFRDGWVYTGDTMAEDPAQGWLYLGRSDSILNIGGMKIVPSEVEDRILAVPGVDACAVVGVPDDDDITRIIAYVVPDAEADDTLKGTVLAELRRTLPPFKRPRVLRVVDALPTTSTGKTARFLIRQRELERR
ncbi:benzoate-CoA ligase family protein [Streptomyces sp. WMMC1477]|uniref:benzoate-CoA ligase family protein n=1 Tax=Streptomyces sp. WMMC1477 TaxID=3015155 RepID=UPI0022B6868E|nr:benzoate-CoA ligase family protein [Streptomyces sp. WMMC1477]MCZ7434186.1 benzoate-CoA ligase family protein [Streptomyces sp. WMMC1477]